MFRTLFVCILFPTLAWSAAPPPASPAPAFERVPVPYVELPYAPGDHTTVDVNPPAFTFLPPAGFKPGRYRYTLEYSPDPTFRSPATIRQTGLTQHIVLPRQPLSPGVWHWRCGIETPDGPRWNHVRTFTVPETAPIRPTPDFAKAAAAIPRQRPRLIITADQLPEWRRRAAAGELDVLIKPLKEVVAPSIGAPLPPEPEFLPRKQGPEWGVIYKRINRNLVDLRRMEECALLYLLTGEQQYGLEAKRRLLHFFSWDPEGSTSLAVNDDQAMWIMRRGVVSYDWTADLFTPEEQQVIERSQLNRIHQYERALRKRPFDSKIYISHDNGYLYNIGEALVSWLPEHPELFDTFEWVMTVFYARLPIHGGDDGGWNEGPAYWAMTMDRILRFLYCVKGATGLNPALEKPFFANTGYYLVYGWPGRSRQSSFGDGPTNMPNQAEKTRSLALLTGNHHFLKPAFDRNRKFWPDVLNFLALPLDSREPDLSDLPLARLFPSIGFVAMRTDLQDYDNDVGLLFQSNPFGLISHHLNAQNAFLLEAYSEPLAISSGYYDYYGSPHHLGWTRETKAHCAITFDGGKGQKRDSRSVGNITRFHTDRDFDCAVGEAGAAYDGQLTRSRRSIVHVRPGIFVIYDENDAPEPRIIEFNLHAPSPFHFDESAQTAGVTLPKAALQVHFFADRPWKFTASDRFDAPPPQSPKYPDQHHFRAAETAPVKQSRLLTVLCPIRNGDTAALPDIRPIRTDKVRGVKFLNPDGGRTVVVFALDADASEIEFADLRRNGRILAVRFSPDGKTTAVFPAAPR